MIGHTPLFFFLWQVQQPYIFPVEYINWCGWEIWYPTAS